MTGKPSAINPSLKYIRVMLLKEKCKPSSKAQPVQPQEGGHTPAEWTMHFGAPVVPEEYMIKRGWLKGSCSNSSWGAWSPFPVARKSSKKTLHKKEGKKKGTFQNFLKVLPQPMCKITSVASSVPITCLESWKYLWFLLKIHMESPPLSLGLEALEEGRKLFPTFSYISKGLFCLIESNSVMHQVTEIILMHWVLKPQRTELFPKM